MESRLPRRPENIVEFSEGKVWFVRQPEEANTGRGHSPTARWPRPNKDDIPLGKEVGALDDRLIDGSHGHHRKHSVTKLSTATSRPTLRPVKPQRAVMRRTETNILADGQDVRYQSCAVAADHHPRRFELELNTDDVRVQPANQYEIEAFCRTNHPSMHLDADANLQDQDCALTRCRPTPTIEAPLRISYPNPSAQSENDQKCDGDGVDCNAESQNICLIEGRDNEAQKNYAVSVERLLELSTNENQLNETQSSATSQQLGGTKALQYFEIGRGGNDLRCNIESDIICETNSAGSTTTEITNCCFEAASDEVQPAVEIDGALRYRSVGADEEFRTGENTPSAVAEKQRRVSPCRCCRENICLILTVPILLMASIGIFYLLLGDTNFTLPAGNSDQWKNGREELYSCAIRFLALFDSKAKTPNNIVVQDLETKVSDVFRSPIFGDSISSVKLVDLTMKPGMAGIFLKVRRQQNGIQDTQRNEGELTKMLLQQTCIGVWNGVNCDGRHFIDNIEFDPKGVSFTQQRCARPYKLPAGRPTGILCSSNYTYGFYPPQQRCEWILTAPVGMFLKLVFHHFETEKFYDVLSVYSERDSDQKLIARLSGKIKNGTDLFVTNHKARMIFTSDSVTERIGFFMTYQVMSSSFPPSTGCTFDNVTLRGQRGSFTSANYPFNYLNGIKCKWIISVPDENAVISFVINDFKTKNFNDALRIYTSRRNETLLFKTLFGSVTPQEIQTNSNYVVVLFISDGFMNERGFHIDYTSSIRDGCHGENECTDGGCYPDLFSCDGIPDCNDATDEIGCESGCGDSAYHNLSEGQEVMLQSSNYPRKYGNTESCIWFITASDISRVVAIRIVDFSTELTHDVLKIYNGIGRNKTLIDKRSGDDDSDTAFVVMSPFATLEFTSDRSVTKKGFRLAVTAANPEDCYGQYKCADGRCIPHNWQCDGTLDCIDGEDESACDSGCNSPAEISEETILLSPLYPGKYLRSSNCEWRIRTYNDSLNIVVRFVDFYTEANHDILSIYEGVGRNKTQAGTFSGSTQPATYESKGSSITLAFVCDGTVGFRGFNTSISFAEKGACPGRFMCLEDECVEWSQVCDGRIDCRNSLDELRCPSRCGGQRELDNRSGSFSSMNYPEYYVDNLRCEWRIYGKQNELIQLEFDHFDTERNFDKLLLFSGSEPTDRKYVGYMSGDMSGTFYRSRYHQISLVFVTDASSTRRGFNISYQVGEAKDLHACPRNSPVIALGMQSGRINDSQITATSRLSPRWSPANGRLNNAIGAWASGRIPESVKWRKGRRNQWIQVDLLRPRLLTGLISQGYNSSHNAFYVKSFGVDFSRRGRRWQRYNEGRSRKAKIFTGNNDGDTIRVVRFDHPFVARFVRILPQDWTGHFMVMRLELLGCEKARAMSLDGEACGDDDIQCGDGSCIRREFACDGKRDCDDGIDEEDCENCRSYQFQCRNGGCVLAVLRCNGKNDCVDESDEADCSRCHGDEFQCDDESACLSRKRVCDGYADCSDFSDEKNCSHDWLCADRADYKCASGSCVPGMNSKCNGFTECSDGSDEVGCDCGISTAISSSRKYDNFTLSRGRRSLRRVLRIVGGQPAENGSWPWQVSLENAMTGDHFCGGALIDRDTVVTAAHCLTRHTAKSLRVKIGSFYRTDNNAFANIRNVSAFSLHPRYDDQTMDFDIAVLHLTKTEIDDTRHMPVCLPSPNHVFHEGQNCWVTGWGTLSVNGKRPDVLQEAEIQLLSNEDCNRPLWYAGKITSRMVCAGDSAGSVDSCKGDSGGPLVCQERSGRWFLAGIVSWGIGCGVAYKPGVYTRVSEFVHWINATAMSGNSSNFDTTTFL